MRPGATQPPCVKRAQERAIRHTKTELIGLREAIDDCTDAEARATLETQYTATAKRLERQNLKYNDFCDAHGLKRQADRLQVAAWTRADAAKSIAAARKV